MKMLQFAFVAVLALLPVSNFSMELNRFPLSSLQNARLGDFQELCKWFCGDQYYHDYFLRALDDVVQPRIFCGLCKKKVSTTTSPTTTSTVTTSTTTPTTTSSTTTPTTTSSTITPTSTSSTTTPTTTSSTTTSSTTTTVAPTTSPTTTEPTTTSTNGE